MTADHAEQTDIRNTLRRPLTDHDHALALSHQLGRADWVLIDHTARHAGPHGDPVPGCPTCDLLVDLRAALNTDMPPAPGVT